MSALPRVAESTREQITREFDDVGPDACVAEISAHLRENNPEWLYMAAKCAGDVGDPRRIMGGFCMFYRLLIAQAAPSHPMTMESGAPAELNPLPRVSMATIRNCCRWRTTLRPRKTITSVSCRGLRCCTPHCSCNQRPTAYRYTENPSRHSKARLISTALSLPSWNMRIG